MAVQPGWDIHREYRTGHIEVGRRGSRCSSCWAARLTISRADALHGVSSAALVADAPGDGKTQTWCDWSQSPTS